MRYSGRTDRDEEGPWFRLGQLDVTTTVGILLLWGVMLIVFVIEPIDKPLNTALVLDVQAVRDGEVWRLVTWPFAMLGFGLSTIITAAVFWMFGTELERQTYRVPFLRLFIAIVAIYTLFYVVLSILLGGNQYAAGLSMPTFAVVLLYIAEHPQRPFFFGIPAWVIGAVIVALEVINDLAYRQWIQLLTVIFASAAIAVFAKRVGLLSMYDQIPDLRIPGAAERQVRKAERQREKDRAKRSTAGSGGLGARFNRKDAEIVEMPTSATRPRPRPVPVVPDDVSADDIALDALLDKISASGIDSLSADERRQLDEIRERRRHD